MEPYGVIFTSRIPTQRGGMQHELLYVKALNLVTSFGFHFEVKCTLHVLVY